MCAGDDAQVSGLYALEDTCVREACQHCLAKDDNKNMIKEIYALGAGLGNRCRGHGAWDAAGR